MGIIKKLLGSEQDKLQSKTKYEKKEEERAKKFIERLSKIPREERAIEFILMPVEKLKPICDNEKVMDYVLKFCNNEMERMAVLSIFNRETEHKKGQETDKVI